ncbi:hypothetical protein PV327_006296 [Microctonus hyperodae]|uniref:DNL-type domain-containing protein n=1 Tax=Microctonus hyperodae TaxID=165561 RepID=A0AA39F423_MICHY|nr:hypothetical protein PV327_006296 [Microctonus hyperodae]
MLGLRQILRRSLKVANESWINSFLSNQHQLRQDSYKFLINNDIIRSYTLKTNTDTVESNAQDDKDTKHSIGKLEARLMIKFTCKKCKTRNSKTMSKLAYEKGVVIIRCDGCKNNHLIADNLSWFGNESQKRNIEKLMAMNGEKVRRINGFNNELFQVVTNEEMISAKKTSQD